MMNLLKPFIKSINSSRTVFIKFWLLLSSYKDHFIQRVIKSFNCGYQEIIVNIIQAQIQSNTEKIEDITQLVKSRKNTH